MEEDLVHNGSSFQIDLNYWNVGSLVRLTRDVVAVVVPG